MRLLVFTSLIYLNRIFLSLFVFAFTGFLWFKPVQAVIWELCVHQGKLSGLCKHDPRVQISSLRQ